MPDCKSDHNFSGHFCVNPACPLYGRKDEGNIRLKGHCGKGLRLHELTCTKCRKAFSENHGTPFYQSHLPRERVLDIVRHLLEGCGVRGTARLLGHHRDTVVRCLRLVGPHVLAVLNSLLVDLQCPEIQMDEFWAFVRKKEKHATAAEKLQQGYGDRWIHLAMDAVSRLIVAWGVDRRTQKATDELVSNVAARLENPRDVLYTSDQHEPYKVALARLNEADDPEPEKARDDPATEPPQASRSPGLVHATVKKTYKEGRCVKVERVLELGTPEDLRHRLDQSPVSEKVNTSFIERLNNTFRQEARRVARKTLGFSKEPDLLEAQVVLQIAHYNLVRPHAGLTITDTSDGRRKRNVLRTPAMAAGLTSSRWSLLELLTFKVSPPNAAPGQASRSA